MIDEYRHLIINDEEYEHIISELNKRKDILFKILDYRGMTHWKYEISTWMHFKDMDKTLQSLLNSNHYRTNINYHSSFGWDQERISNTNDEGMNLITKINFLSVSKDHLRCRVSIQSPTMVGISEFRNGVMVRTYFDLINNKIDITPATEDDKLSKHQFGIKLTFAFVTILLYKLLAEENGNDYKMFHSGANVVRIKGLDAFNDMIMESEKYYKNMFRLYDYPLYELDVVTEREFGSVSGKPLYGFSYAHYSVSFNDDDMYIVNLKLYYESVTSKKHIVLDADVTGLKDEQGLSEVHINTNNLPVDETVLDKQNSPDFDKSMSIDDFMNKVHKEYAEKKVIYHFIMFQYIMYCMAEPKKTIEKDVKPTKKSPSGDKSHKQLQEAVTVLIKQTGYKPPRKPVMNPGSGSKHSYEYERQGSWCVRKSTGTRYWRRGTTCCKGRGPKATHVYEIKEKEQ